MQSDPTTALEKLYEAVLRLASEEGRIEARLERIYFDHLQTLDSKLLPAAVRGEWDAILRELQRMYPARGKLNGSQPSQAIDLAQRILLVYDSLIR